MPCPAKWLLQRLPELLPMEMYLTTVLLFIFLITKPVNV